MQEDANVERRISTVELRKDQNTAVGTLALEVGRSAFDVRIFLHLALILLAGLFIYGLWLGDSPLDRTEPFRALVAHQMVKGGSWLVPRLYGELYLRKPPLIYWIEAGAEKTLGRGNEFVWRLPSAVGSALLAVFLGWWSGRWFGRRAILPAGFACLALVAVWDQDRGADIDALNTAFAIVTTCCVLELLYGNSKSLARWSIALGLALGATLLLKGPGGVPQAIAAMVGPALILRDWKPLRRRIVQLSIGFLVGFAIFTAYIISAKIQMHRLHVVPDPTGWYEIIEKIFFHDLAGRLRSLGLPFAMVVFAVPVSAVLPFALVLIRRMPRDDPQRVQAIALLATLAAALLIWVLAGNDNPRYEYVMLPLLAPLVGFVWTRWDHHQVWFQRALLCIGLIFVIADGAVMLKTHWMPGFWIVSIVALIGLVLLGWFYMHKELAAEAASPVVVVLLLSFAIPMAARKNAERKRKSAKTPAAQLRAIIGNADRVSASGVVRDLPELFYYANVDVDAYGEFGLPELVQHRGHWIVVSQGEKYPAFSTIMKYIPKAFPRGVTKLNMPDPRDQIYVGWYNPPADADTRIEWKVEKSVEAED